jgi:hypothetical protein
LKWLPKEADHTAMQFKTVISGLYRVDGFNLMQWACSQTDWDVLRFGMWVLWILPTSNFE